MNQRQPDDEMPIELLAAYADGELDDVRTAQVEAWLAEHPEAWSELEAQKDFSPGNDDWLTMTATPMPSEWQWDESLQHIAARALPPMMPVRIRSRWMRSFVPGLALASLAAILLIVVFINRPRSKLGQAMSLDPAVVAPIADDDEEGVFKVATADDVELIQLPEEAYSLIVVGRHPVFDSPIVLATTTDVDIFNLGPDDQGRMPSVEMIAGPYKPMVVAQAPRR